ncbi:hypothetical protein PG994_006756 [Apiospora phragmitis]|uniref:F-box domain-containing protein n=1 Tax=Apiospora phragmitis TaxID=2905665 RepID=A0ABR1VG21_9PEZI
MHSTLFLQTLWPRISPAGFSTSPPFIPFFKQPISFLNNNDTPFFELPLELFDEIFSHVDTRDLVTLACVNRTFYDYATREICDSIRKDWQKQHGLFMWACGTGSTRALCRLLEDGVTSNFTYQAAHSTQHVTSAADSIILSSHVVDVLLEHGAWIDAACMSYCHRKVWSLVPEGKYTPLHVALCMGKEDTAKSLIYKGASIYVDREVRRPQRTYGPDRGRLTAFHCCAIDGRLSKAEFLIKQGHGAALDEIDEFGFSPSCASPRITTTTPRPNVRTRAFRPDFISMLQQACFDNRAQYLTELISQASDEHEPGRNGEQLLFHCINNTMPEMLELVAMLLGKGSLEFADISCHMRALKDLAYRGYFYDDDRQLLGRCTQLICLQLPHMLQSEFGKPPMPLDLLYICLEGGQRNMLDELASVFDFTYARYGKYELWRLF